jgi:hypothetical protein
MGNPSCRQYALPRVMVKVTTPPVRFSAKVEEPEVEVGLLQRLALVPCSWNCVQV